MNAPSCPYGWQSTFTHSVLDECHNKDGLCDTPSLQCLGSFPGKAPQVCSLTTSIHSSYAQSPSCSIVTPLNSRIPLPLLTYLLWDPLPNLLTPVSSLSSILLFFWLDKSQFDEISLFFPIFHIFTLFLSGVTLVLTNDFLYNNEFYNFFETKFWLLYF